MKMWMSLYNRVSGLNVCGAAAYFTVVVHLTIEIHCKSVFALVVCGWVV